MASPVKRRILAPLDANTTVPSPLLAKNALAGNKPSLQGSGTAPLPSLTGTGEEPRTSAPTLTPEQPSLAAQKRPLPQDGPEDKGQPTDRTPKKTCLDMHVSTGDACSAAPKSAPASATRRHCSMSPTPSSVFDSSGIVDTSQATNITEPDLEATRPAGPQTLTREQSRRRAEILKLRLGLARYKLRTGQVSVPLEQLRMVPPLSQLARSQSHNTLHSHSPSQSRSRTPLPMSPKPDRVSRPDYQQLQPQLPRRQWSAWDQGRGLSNGIAATAAYSDSSSDEDDFITLRRREMRGAAAPKAPLPRHPMSSQNELDHIDRIEDSDGQAGSGDNDEDNNEDVDNESNNEADVHVHEGVRKETSGGVSPLPQLPQHQSSLSGGAQNGLLSVSRS